MKKSILALFIACSTFLFTACDDPKPQVVQEEAKASEPAEPTKEIPAQSPEATSPTATETAPAAATEMPAQPNTNMAEPAPLENATATAPATTEEPAPANAAAQATQAAQPKNATAAPTSVKATNKQAAHKQELVRVLSMLEKQYTQVRCVNDIKDDSGKIKMDSYCRQEEERLIREMQRVKRELAK
jgi:raw score 16.02